jgi:hypothetical protein
MSELNEEPEKVDAYIAAYFATPEAVQLLVHCFALPYFMQISRDLRGVRRLLEQAPHRKNCASDSEGAQDDIQPEQLVAEARGGPLVRIDRLGELLHETHGKGAFDFLNEFAGRLARGAKELHEFGDWLVQVNAGAVGVVTHGASPAGAGETVKG